MEERVRVVLGEDERVRGGVRCQERILGSGRSHAGGTGGGGEDI